MGVRELSHERSEVRDGMRIDRDVPIEMDDGVVLRADVYRPIEDGEYPVILTYGPYAKNMPFQVLYADQWRAMILEHPEIAEGSTCNYQSWEVVDPEKWVPDSYVCVRVDSRGAGRSPGYIDIFSPRETKDFYNCVEWSGTQSWSNGKVGLNGISYYAINQWQVAGLQPPHLAAMCPWEGAADAYRDWHRHGGIMSTFTGGWYRAQVQSVQHGVGVRGERDPNNGMLTSGPETLSEEELAKNRSSPDLEARLQPLDGLWYRERSADWSKVKVPFLSCGSWGGAGLHLRGNVEGFVRAASEQKWLEIHGLEHWTHFYTDYGLKLQKRFFDHFLKGEDNGWDQEAPVLLNIRHPGEHFVLRSEQEWPLARTQWTKYYLNPADETLSTQRAGNESELEYAPLTSDGVTFWMEPFDQETEITGPLAAKVFMSSQTIDADLFLIVQLFDPNGEEVTFAGSVEPAAPIAQGWLRASQRKLDPELSTEYQPYHTHDEQQFLTPGEVYELDVEIWPTCIVIPPEHRLAFTIQGHDLERATVSGTLGTLGTFRGSGPFLHTDSWDRRPERVGGNVTIYGGGDRESYLLLPIIPAGVEGGGDGEG
jgi:predicted acyl esterase